MALFKKKATNVTKGNFTKKEEGFTEKQIEKAVEEYNDISVMMKKYETRKKELAGIIKDYAMKNGTTTDTGFILENSKFQYGATIPKSVKIKEDAPEILINDGHADIVTEKIVREVDEKALQVLYETGEVTGEYVQSLFDVKEGTPRIFVKAIVEEEMVDIKKVASKKKGRE